MPNVLRGSMVLLFSASLLAGCGYQPTPTTKAASQTMHALGQAKTDDTDLSGGGALVDRLGAGLQREAIGRVGKDLLFRTQIIAPMTGRSVQPKDGAVQVTGVLSYPDFAGKLIPAANVTVHLETKGLLGGGRQVGSVVTDAQGRWVAELPTDMAGKAVSVSYELGNRYWTINKYRWDGPKVESLRAVNDTGERSLDPQANNGQAALIHQIWNRALTAFEREDIPLDWWSRRIGTNWPANGDYFSMNTVNLTEAKQWDVNGHEIGHAIFFNGLNSSGGGGPHKIDECYSGGLAWSEGFASFFSAVISIRRDDPDAKFEYMVPRRKPIRIENVPADVCEGYTNEWRVSSALWDLYDTNEDGTDRAALPFKTIWGALVKTNGTPRMSDVRDGYRLIVNAVPAGDRPALAAAFAQSGVPMDVRLAGR